jgi:RNA polymerase primary sigma factor
LVLTSRFGLDGEEPQPLSQVAEESKISKERVRQIEAKAIRKLRHPSMANPLLEIIDVS